MRQRGGMLSLLAALLVIGLLAWFALRSTTARQATGADTAATVNCSKAASDLMSRTGGLGPDYKAGYEALPAACRSFLPPPQALSPAEADPKSE